jgi:DNA repair protein RecO (recombination protein O)
MSKRRADNEVGYVLHTYPYKETSLIVEAFTRRFGRVAMLARGARRPRSAMRGVLLAFHPLRLGWAGSTDLATLMAVEWAGASRSLAGIGLMCGFYVNELLLRLLPRDDPHEDLFDFYAASLQALSTGDEAAPVLRAFEKRLLGEVGYAPALELDAESRPIEPDLTYVYEPDRGPVRARGAPAGEAVVSGRTLLDLAQDEYARPQTRDEARTLMRMLIGHRLHGQALHTRAILMELNEL